MAIERVREYFRQFGREQDILEFPVSSATVELAANRTCQDCQKPFFLYERRRRVYYGDHCRRPENRQQ